MEIFINAAGLVFTIIGIVAIAVVLFVFYQVRILGEPITFAYFPKNARLPNDEETACLQKICDTLRKLVAYRRGAGDEPDKAETDAALETVCDMLENSL